MVAAMVYPSKEEDRRRTSSALSSRTTDAGSSDAEMPRCISGSSEEATSPTQLQDTPPGSPGPLGALFGEKNDDTRAALRRQGQNVLALMSPSIAPYPAKANKPTSPGSKQWKRQGPEPRRRFNAERPNAARDEPSTTTAKHDPSSDANRGTSSIPAYINSAGHAYQPPLWFDESFLAKCCVQQQAIPFDFDKMPTKMDYEAGKVPPMPSSAPWTAQHVGNHAKVPPPVPFESAMLMPMKVRVDGFLLEESPSVFQNGFAL